LEISRHAFSPDLEESKEKKKKQDQKDKDMERRKQAKKEAWAHVFPDSAAGTPHIAQILLF